MAYTTQEESELFEIRNHDQYSYSTEKTAHLIVSQLGEFKDDLEKIKDDLTPSPIMEQDLSDISGLEPFKGIKVNTVFTGNTMTIWFTGSITNYPEGFTIPSGTKIYNFPIPNKIITHTFITLQDNDDATLNLVSCKMTEDSIATLEPYTFKGVSPTAISIPMLPITFIK